MRPRTTPPARRLLAAIGLVAITGCATAPRVQLAPDVKERLRRIAVLETSEPRLEVENRGGGAPYTLGVLGGLAGGAVGGLGGAIGGAALGGGLGGLVQSQQNGTKRDAYARRAAEAGITFGPELARALQGALAEDGYEVELLGVGAGIGAEEAQPKLHAVRTNADAVLVVWCERLGYVSPFSTSLYEPWALVRARLVDPRSGTVLYDKTFTGGYEAHIEEAVAIPSDPRYRYDSFENLGAMFDDSILGLRATVGAVVQKVGQDLRRGR